MAYGFPMIGDLRGLTQSEIDKTNICIKAMLAQRQKDIDYRKNIDRRLKSLEEEKTALLSKIDDLQKKDLDHIKIIDLAKTNLEAIQERYKKEQNKLIADRDEAQKRFLQIQSQQTHYLNEIRKKEAELKRVQERVFEIV